MFKVYLENPFPGAYFDGPYETWVTIQDDAGNPTVVGRRSSSR
jgi:hypothetical protein